MINKLFIQRNKGLLAFTFLIAITALVIPSSILAESGTPSDEPGKNPSGTEPMLQIDDAGLEGVGFDIVFPEMKESSLDVEGTFYQFIHMEGFGKLGEVGKPALPMRNYQVAVPEGCEVQVNILESQTKVLSGYRIHPALEPAIDTAGAPEPEFIIDENFYKSDGLYPSSPVQVVAINKLRGIPLARIQVCPVIYNPARSELTVYTSLKFNVEFVDKSGTSPGFSFVDRKSPFGDVISNVVMNNNSVLAESTITKETESGDGERSDLIIVTTTEFEEAAETLAKWKRQMGYETEVVSQASWTSSQVKSTIHDRYDSWNPKPDYFVIIGDHEDVPAETSTLDRTHVTDIYYACMDGPSDYYPDMAHGRISVSNATEANAVVNKIINYEIDPPSNPDFYHQSAVCSQFQDYVLDDWGFCDEYPDGYANRRFAQTSEEIRDHLLLKGYTVDRIYALNEPCGSINPTNWNNGVYSSGEPIPTELLKPGFAWDGNTTDIINTIDDGRFLLLHRDHGYSGGAGWVTPEFTTGDISDLANGDLLPLVFSINCTSGEFDQTECFAEKFLRFDGSTEGAIGVFAPSDASYSGNNDGLAEGFIDAIWPGLVPSFPHNPDPSVTPHEPLYSMGDVLNQGKLRMTETWGDSNPPFNHERYTFELFHYFGDPTMQIWTASPGTISATHGDHIILGQTSFPVSNVSSGTAVATLVQGGTLIGKGDIIDGSGTITISSTPIQVGTATLTISQHNWRPYQTDIVVIDYIYVNAIASGSEDGTSWVDAYTNLQDALDVADFGNEIWVASGTYVPTATNGGTSTRHQSFQMKNGVSIFGGFPNTGSPNWEQRDLQNNRTVLSGEIGNPSTVTDNCYHVFYHPGSLNLNSNAVLDGFTITGGNAYGAESGFYNGGGIYNDESSLTIRNCVFTKNKAKLGGGGMLNMDSALTITNCTFAENKVDGWSYISSGGAMWNLDSNVIISNCVFRSNTATGNGGAIRNEFVGYSLDATFTNCIFYSNSTLNGDGGAIYNYDCSPTFTNCILWSDSPNEVYSVLSGSPTITYCDVGQSGYAGSNGNINTDPLWLSPTDGDFHLQSTSPCINVGTNSAVGLAVTDFEGDDRIIDEVVDMGVDEFVPEVNVDIYINLQGSNRPTEGWDVPIAVGFFPANCGTLVLSGSSKAIYWFEGTTSGTSTVSGTRAYFQCPELVAAGTYDITADSETTLLNVKRSVAIN